MPVRLSVAAFVIATLPTIAASKPPIYLWLEPEWFDGVSGSFAYWPERPAEADRGVGHRRAGHSAEWTQGGESEWNSIGASAAETKAECRRDFVVPRAGKYRVWVRYVDHRKKTEPFTASIRQDGKAALLGELGVKPVVPVNDEYQLYWGFSFGWGVIDGELAAGRARLTLTIDKAGEAWRQVDAVLVTDDLAYTPIGREKPPFAYLGAFDAKPTDGTNFRGKGVPVGASWKRPQLGGSDFSMWTGGLDGDPKWWDKPEAAKVTRNDLLFQFAPPQDIRDQFHKQFAGKKDVPILSWPG